MNQAVIVTRKDAVLTLKINRPDDENRINRAAMEAIVGGLTQAEADPTIRVVVITGTPEYFCSGGRVDVDANGNFIDQPGYARAIAAMHEQLDRIPAPVIAAVSGHCVAGGTALLAGADLAIAVEDAEFGFPEINHGRFPVLALASAMPLFPKKRAFEAFYFGERFSAQEALDLHLVNKVVPRSSFDAAVDEFVHKLLSKNPASLPFGRKAYYAMENMSPASRIAHGQALLQGLLAGAEAGGFKG